MKDDVTSSLLFLYTTQNVNTHKLMWPSFWIALEAYKAPASITTRS